MFNSKHEHQRFVGMRADVDSLQARLAADVSNLDAGDDPVCRQALVDASERATAAGALMSRAVTVAELDVAKRTVLEGLTATRLVRERKGLPLGPDLPPDPRTVDVPTAVEVDGAEHTAHPAYHPDRPHFFGGLPGAGAPAGYYRTPFWQKALAFGGALAGAEMLGDLLGGGLGGGQGWGGDDDGGGYDGGFDGGGYDGGDGGGGDWG